MSSEIPRARKGIRLSAKEMVRFEYLEGTEKFPLVLTPGVDDLNLAQWTAERKAMIEHELLRHGAILFRGFRNETVEQFSRFFEALTSEPLEYRERAAPRTEIKSYIYTSTEYPADQTIPLHHEMSYSHNWPTKLLIYCRRPAVAGGRTPIADDRKVFEMLAPSIKRRFLEKGVMYVRNYGEGLDLSWQEVFQTEDRAAVEQYCRDAIMTCEWTGPNRLRTRAVRQVVVSHPKVGARVWFNHAHLFHSSNLGEQTRTALLAQFREDELPRNAFYGDGSTIEDAIMDEVRETYERAAVAFDWRQGDILLLDNFLSSHGREPYTGPREILVAMAERFTLDVARLGDNAL